MRIRWTVPAVMLAFVAACDDTLTLEPVNEVPAEAAIVDAATARAAMAGAYDAVQDDANISYYSGDFTVYGDLLSDDVMHTGTFGTYLEADLNQLREDNGTIEDIWEQLYVGISRVNIIIEKLPGVPGLDADERDDLLGQAYFLRALHYANLARYWGGVPLRLTTPTTVQEASEIGRSTVDETYTQILADLAQAEDLIANENDPTIASRGAVFALRSRVLLYREQWAGVISNADSVEAYGYDLAADFEELFQAEGETEEDIFKVTYTPEEAHFLGWYYRAKGGFGGRWEVGPTCALVKEFDSDVNCGAVNFMANWTPTDQRAALSVEKNGDTEAFGSKYPTGIGDEDLHVIRFAEVILNRAEAKARSNDLLGAVADYNRTRVRAGLPAHVLLVDVITQQDVLNAIWRERRLELAFEGFRFSDLVRTGRAVAALNIQDRPHQVLFPIPRQELDVAPNLTQNPGY